MPLLCRLLLLFVACAACGDDTGPKGPIRSPEGSASTVEDEASFDITLASEVQPVRSTEDALERVFIPPYLDCRAPLDGEPAGQGPNGQVCTPVSIAGCTEEGRYYAEYADCDVVRTQRPFWSAAPYATPRADDPRLEDPAFMAELSWVTEQVEASGCVCCHDSRAVDGEASQWDIALGPIWTDTVSERGVALFTGLADSAVLGSYEPEQNNGFERSKTGLPSTDPERMRAFFVAELARRGVSLEQATAEPPFGGPLYANTLMKPEACTTSEGLDAQGRLRWDARYPARYVYVLAQGSTNPGVPPNFDRPEGTLWRLDVLPSAEAVPSGLAYGTTPRGSFQSIPERGRAPALEAGKTYQLYVLFDVGFVIANCLFTVQA